MSDAEEVCLRVQWINNPPTVQSHPRALSARLDRARYASGTRYRASGKVEAAWKNGTPQPHSLREARQFVQAMDSWA